MTLNISEINSILNCAKEDLKSTSLSPSQATRATRTIQDFMAINQNLLELSSLNDDKLSNKLINKITSGAAEDGFSAGNGALVTKIQLFTETYFKSKSRGDLKGFFSCFSNGAPCLNGRTESLAKYAALLENINIDSMPDPEKSLYLPGTIFGEIIMENFEDGTDGASFVAYVKENIEVIAREFETASPEYQAPFIEALSMSNVYSLPESEEIDWKTAILNLVDSRYFSTVFQQTLTYVL